MINKVSKKNTIGLSNGKRISRVLFEGNVRNAKRIFKFDCADNERAYCWDCGITSALTASHIVSVKRCVEEGKGDCAWDMDNLELLCMACHLKYESTKEMNYNRENYIEKFNKLKK